LRQVKYVVSGFLSTTIKLNYFCIFSTEESSVK